MVIYWLKNVGYYESIHSVNPICFIVGEVDEYIKEENGKKYLAFASTVVLETYAEQWNKIKSLIKKISDKQGDYDEKYIKIRFNSDDKFRLNFQVEFRASLINYFKTKRIIWVKACFRRM